jgi:hemin uptake protein HemP
MMAPPPPAVPRPAPATTAPPQPVLRSEQLFGGAQEVLIEHRGSVYRLKLTSLGKLILTK